MCEYISIDTAAMSRTVKGQAMSNIVLNSNEVFTDDAQIIVEYPHTGNPRVWIGWNADDVRVKIVESHDQDGSDYDFDYDSYDEAIEYLRHDLRRLVVFTRSEITQNDLNSDYAVAKAAVQLDWADEVECEDEE
jgi:hypothetical protein